MPMEAPPHPQKKNPNTTTPQPQKTKNTRKKKKSPPTQPTKQKNQVGKYAVVPEIQCYILDMLHLPVTSKDKNH